MILPFTTHRSQLYFTLHSLDIRAQRSFHNNNNNTPPQPTPQKNQKKGARAREATSLCRVPGPRTRQCCRVNREHTRDPKPCRSPSTRVLARESCLTCPPARASSPLHAASPPAQQPEIPVPRSTSTHVLTNYWLSQRCSLYCRLPVALPWRDLRRIFVRHGSSCFQTHSRGPHIPSLSSHL